MPSASVKSDSSGSVDTQDPLGKVYLLIEKKIRNLEKRKNKLENYKLELVEGKKLNDDQQRAVGAFDAVVASLELCRELSTQIHSVMVENTKAAKLQQKKHQEEKAQHEFDRIKQVLRIQDTLARLKQKDVRADFLAGRNGAITLKEDKLRQLDELSLLVSPPTGPDRELTVSGFKGQVNVAAENFLNLLDGRNKPAAAGATYRDMKTLVYQVANCPYPKKPRPTASTQTAPQATPQVIPEQVAVETPSPPPDQGSETTNQAAQVKNKKPVKQTKDLATNVTTTAVNGTGDEGRGKTAPPPKKVGPAPPVAAVPLSTTHSVPAAAPPPPAAAAPPPAPSLPTPVTPVKSNSAPPAQATPVSGKPKRRSDPPLVEGPPPGIAPVGIQANPPDLIASAALAAPVRTPALTHAHPAFLGARVQMDINELVTASSFNFLQESQVAPPDTVPTPPTAVYVDPAVVSFGSVKSPSEGMVRQRLGPGPAEVGPPPPQVGPIQSETFVNSAFSSSTAPSYSPQPIPTYSAAPPSAAPDPGLPPAPIPMPTLPPPQPEKTPPAPPTFESTSWAAQEEVDGWGAPDPPTTTGPLNGGDTGGDGWGMPDDNGDSSGWGDEAGDVKQSHQVGGMSHDSGVSGDDRRGGYRGGSGMRVGGRNRGNSGYVMRGGGRGGNNNYGGSSGSYVIRGGGRGGNNNFGGNSGYIRGRGGPGSNGGGYRGRGGYSRGGRGNEGSSRGLGGSRGRGGYQGNQMPSQRSQY